MAQEISISVIKRLPRYYRFLENLKDNGIVRISSKELAERMGLTASQIRHDFNCFGGFGQQGYGYNVSELRNEIGSILGVDKQRKTILIGAGNLGKAIALHINFEKYGCRLCGIFDSDESVIGTELGVNKILSVEKLSEFCRQNQPQIAILCIPKAAAAQVCELLINLGVRAFWNFSHYDINLEYSDIVVENVHLGDSILALCYGVNNMTEKE